MFPNKIKLTNEYIDLIVKKRKEHGLTAYFLSEKIGKNKSWLPNIENHRTKNINKEDFLLIFNDFAKEENLETEKYIIKYLHPNATIELEDGSFVPCHYLQTKLELLSIEVTPYEYLNSYNFYKKEIPLQDSLNALKIQLSDLNELILEEASTMTEDEISAVSNSINIMEYNLKVDFNVINTIYGINLFEDYLSNPDSSFSKDFLKELKNITTNYSNDIALLNARSKVYTFFSESNSYYTINRKMANLEYENFNELVEILEEIEQYIFSVYNYIKLTYEIAKQRNVVPVIEYRKLYNIMDRYLKGFVNIAALSYDFDSIILEDDTTEEIWKENHLKINNIFFQIKQVFHNKYQQ